MDEPGPGPGGSARVAVLASGSGTNLQALLNRFEDGAGTARVVLVVGSSPGVGALERARAAGVETAVVDEPDDEGRRLMDRLEAAGADLVVLAGWLRLVPAPVVRAYRGRMVNIHPALLPSFGGEGMYGRRVHEAVLESGARVTGPTVHFVDEAYDEDWRPIIVDIEEERVDEVETRETAETTDLDTSDPRKVFIKMYEREHQPGDIPPEEMMLAFIELTGKITDTDTAEEGDS